MSQPTDTWTVKATLEWTEGYFARLGEDNPRLTAQWLVGFATGLSRIELYTLFDKPLSAEERKSLRDSIQRRAKGEPLQYITGEAAFRQITLKVSGEVLIPRPETEVLVGEALSFLSTVDSGENEERLIVDLCTGSGCIACSIALEAARTLVKATDISSKALEVARENAVRLGVAEHIDFFECDLGTGIEEEFLGEIDLIVTNPPYIPTQVLDTLPNEVKEFEPLLALDGGTDGLDIFRLIVSWAFSALKPGGALMVELYEECLNQAHSFACEKGFKSVRIVYDLTGKERILVAIK